MIEDFFLLESADCLDEPFKVWWAERGLGWLVLILLLVIGFWRWCLWAVVVVILLGRVQCGGAVLVFGDAVVVFFFKFFL